MLGILGGILEGVLVGLGLLVALVWWVVADVKRAWPTTSDRTMLLVGAGAKLAVGFGVIMFVPRSDFIPIIILGVVVLIFAKVAKAMGTTPALLLRDIVVRLTNH